MTKRHEQPLIDEVLAMLDGQRKSNGSTDDSSVIGADLDVGERLKISDALRPEQLHPTRHKGKFRGNPLREVRR